MKTILFVVPRFHTNLYSATRTLGEAGHRVRVFARGQGNLEDHSVVRPIVFGDDPAPAELERAWRDAVPDLVLIRLAGTLSEQIGRLARRDRTRAYMYSLKPLTDRDSLKDRLRRKIRGDVSHRVTPVPGLDPDRKPDPRATLLPWPVMRLDSADDPATAASSKLRILCVGKLAQPRKNQHKLIGAIVDAGLQSEVHVTFVGSGKAGRDDAERQHYRRLMASADEMPWITVLADVPFREMASLYAGCDICVLPSVGEPLGMAPLESMAYGAVPVISAQAGSAGFVTEGENGMIVDMDRPGKLQDALLRLVRSRELVLRLGQGAEHTARTKLGSQRFLERIERLLA